MPSCFPHNLKSIIFKPRFLKIRMTTTLKRKNQKGETLLQKNLSEKKLKHQKGKLQRSFYNVDSSTLATTLLGKILVRKIDKEILKARIVETESYPGGDDKASMSYNGKRTPRNEALFMEAGTTCVYMTYGMYFCLNVSSKEDGGAVLIRAAEPITGIETITKNRTSKRKKGSKTLKPTELMNGPSKLCMALGMDKNNSNKLDVCTSDELWIEEDEECYEPNEIISSTRIGIDSVGKEWAGRLFRFYILGNEHVSKRDVKKEKELEK